MPTQRSHGLFYLKAGCLLFWTLWLGLATTTNFTDFLFSLGALPADWRFHSGNYALIKAVISIYDTPLFILNLMFVGIIIYEALVTTLFCLAFVKFTKKQNAWRLINVAFGLNIALWGLFLVSEEFFIAYHFESVHSGLFMFQLITLMAMHLLPE